MTEPQVLRAPLVIEYPFSRTTGPVIGAFMTGLREGVVLGIKGVDGRVIVPPTEYDPVTSEALSELVEVGQAGEVMTWSWTEPRRFQPLEVPFAWALIRLDGADTAMLHAVDAGSEDKMATGMRVKIRWREEREGHIRDIECFEPDVMEVELTLPPSIANVELVKSVRTPAQLDYSYTPGAAMSRFLMGLEHKKILGQRCPACSKVYVPPRGACPTDGVPTVEEVELPHRGTVTTFCVVNVQFYGQGMEVPYVSALILLDGADLPLMHLIQEVPYDQVRMGMRVEAVWVPDAELKPTLESIKWWKPTGEPDADPATYRKNV